MDDVVNAIDVVQLTDPKTNEPMYAYWMFKLSGSKIGEDAGPSTNMNLLAMVDSGTSCLMLPLEEYRAFASNFPNSDVNSYACAGGPLGRSVDISVRINNYDYVFSPKDYCLASGQLACVAPNNERFWILGDVFHRKYYTGYDFKNKKVLLPKTTYEFSWGTFLLRVALIALGISVFLAVCCKCLGKCSSSRTRRTTSTPRDFRQEPHIFWARANAPTHDQCSGRGTDVICFRKVLLLIINLF